MEWEATGRCQLGDWPVCSHAPTHTDASPGAPHTHAHTHMQTHKFAYQPFCDCISSESGNFSHTACQDLCVFFFRGGMKVFFFFFFSLSINLTLSKCDSVQFRGRKKHLTAGCSVWKFSSFSWQVSSPLISLPALFCPKTPLYAELYFTVCVCVCVGGGALRGYESEASDGEKARIHNSIRWGGCWGRARGRCS